MSKLVRFCGLGVLLLLTAASGVQAQRSESGDRSSYRTIGMQQLLRRPGGIVGVNPGLVVMRAFGTQEELGTSGGEQMEVKYRDRRAIVLLTQTGLMDDSVTGIRYRVELERQPKTELWQVIWAGEQFRCQSGRGAQDWGQELCR